MAKTYVKRALKVVIPNDAYLSVVMRYVAEGASQTYIAGAPLKNSSGLAVVCSAGDAILGFAMKAGVNGAGGNLVPVIPAVPGVEVYANFLGNGTAGNAANNTVGTGDMFNDFYIDYNATGHANGGPIWFVQDETDGAPAETVRMVSWKSDDIIPNQPELYAMNGDTNARLTFSVLSGKCAWI